MKLRFNLGRGENYKKWQVKSTQGVVHYDPETVVLVLMGAKLTNRKSTAKKIYNGAHKTVCAWVECDHIIVYRRDEVPLAHLNAYKQDQNKLTYNPRVAPYWQDAEGNNVDNRTYKVAATIGKAVFEIPQG